MRENWIAYRELRPYSSTKKYTGSIFYYIAKTKYKKTFAMV
jgi:hypothetical protein